MLRSKICCCCMSSFLFFKDSLRGREKRVVHFPLLWNNFNTLPLICLWLYPVFWRILVFSDFLKNGFKIYYVFSSTFIKTKKGLMANFFFLENRFKKGQMTTMISCFFCIAKGVALLNCLHSHFIRSRWNGNALEHAISSFHNLSTDRYLFNANARLIWKETNR